MTKTITTHASDPMHLVDGVLANDGPVYLAEAVVNGSRVSAWGQTPNLAKVALRRILDGQG